MKFLKVPNCTSQFCKSVVIGLGFLPLKSADARGAGMRDEPLRMSAWEATCNDLVGRTAEILC